MTPKQKETYDAYSAFHDRHKRGPNMRELAKALGKSSHTATYQQVCSLVGQGLLERHGTGRSTIFTLAPKRDEVEVIIDQQGLLIEVRNPPNIIVKVTRKNNGT